MDKNRNFIYWPQQRESFLLKFSDTNINFKVHFKSQFKNNDKQCIGSFERLCYGIPIAPLWPFGTPGLRPARAGLDETLSPAAI